MSQWRLAGWIVLILAVLIAGCSPQYPPGSGENHPLLWFVGISAAWCLFAIGGFFAAGFIRRWERRADRHD
jgi:hypothetical protein